MTNPALQDDRRQAPLRMDLENMQLKVGDVLLGTLWVLEWSQSQQAFHTETLMESLASAILGFCKGGKTGDYVVLGIFASREAVDEYYGRMVDRMRLWDMSHYTADDIDNLLNDASP
jgi:hypothetical protein